MWVLQLYSSFSILFWPFSFLSACSQFSNCTYSLAKVFPQTKDRQRKKKKKKRDRQRTWQLGPRTIGSCSITVVIVIQSLIHAVHQVPLSSTISQNFFKFMSTELVRLSNSLILCCSLLFLPSIFPSIRVFSRESAFCIRWPNYQHQSFQWIFRLIFFRMDWFDPLAVQETLKSLLQHHKSKASILWCSAFFMVQLSHLYMTTGKTIALTRWAFVGKVMSLLFDVLSQRVRHDWATELN